MYPPDFEKDSEQRRTDPTLFSTLDQWKLEPSTKLTALANIVKYILDSDDRLMPKVSRSGDIEASSESLRVETVPCDQVLLYVEFTGTHSTIKSVGGCSRLQFWFYTDYMSLKVLKVFGINAQCLSGSESIQKRDEILRLFHTGKDDKGDTFRVLILSSVGGAGLNITCANWMVFVVCHAFSQSTLCSFPERTNRGALKMNAS